MKIIRLYLILNLLAFSQPTTAAVQQCQNLFSENHSSEFKTTQSRQLKYVIDNNGREKPDDGQSFITNRGFSEYKSWFKAFFNRSANLLLEGKNVMEFYIKNLKPDEALFDGGCGDAFLSDIFFDSFQVHKVLPQDHGATYIGVTYSLVNRSLDFFNSRIKSGLMRLHTGRYFEKIPNEELNPENKRIKIITDYYGIMSYTHRPDLVMKKYLELLARDGVIFFAGDPNLRFPMPIGTDFLYFLRKIKGINVQLTERMSNKIGYGYVVTLSGDPIEIPELRYVRFTRNQGLPYVRHFRLTGRILIVEK